MTRIFQDDGSVVPVSVIEATPNTVTRLRDVEKDGYTAVQLGAGVARRSTKPVAGQFKHLDKDHQRPKHVRELRLDATDGYEVGQEIAVDLFEAGELVDVTGVSKGHGFTGVTSSVGRRRTARIIIGPPARSARAPTRAASGRGPAWPVTWATSR